MQLITLQNYNGNMKNFGKQETFVYFKTKNF